MCGLRSVNTEEKSTWICKSGRLGWVHPCYVILSRTPLCLNFLISKIRRLCSMVRIKVFYIKYIIPFYLWLAFEPSYQKWKHSRLIPYSLFLPSSGRPALLYFSDFEKNIQNFSSSYYYFDNMSCFQESSLNIWIKPYSTLTVLVTWQKLCKYSVFCKTCLITRLLVTGL